MSTVDRQSNFLPDALHFVETACFLCILQAFENSRKITQGQRFFAVLRSKGNKSVNSSCGKVRRCVPSPIISGNSRIIIMSTRHTRVHEDIRTLPEIYYVTFESARMDPKITELRYMGSNSCLLINYFIFKSCSSLLMPRNSKYHSSMW